MLEPEPRTGLEDTPAPAEPGEGDHGLLGPSPADLPPDRLPEPAPAYWKPTRRPGLPPDPPPPWAPLIVPKEGVPIPGRPPVRPSPGPYPNTDAESGGFAPGDADDGTGTGVAGDRELPRRGPGPPPGEDFEIPARPGVPIASWLILAVILGIVIGPGAYRRVTQGYRLRDLNQRLCLAAAEGDARRVRELLDQGAEANARAMISRNTEDSPQPLTLSALGWAVRIENEEIVAALISHGASPNQVDFTTGLTGLDMVRSPRIARHLAVAGGHVTAQTDYRVLSAVVGARLADLQALIRAKAPVDARDYRGFTPLMWAAWLGRPEMVKVLLAAKADRSIQAMDGSSALDLARRAGSAACIRLLEGK